MNVRIAGCGHTRFGRLREGFLDLARAAGREALDDAGVQAVDRVYVSAQAPEAFAGVANAAVAVATELGLAGVAATRVETAPSSGLSAVEAACHAIAAGQAQTALVVGAEKMTTLPTPRASAVLAAMIHPSERRYGLTMPALAALTTRAWMHARGLSREDLAAAPVKAHAHGARNPLAQFRRRVLVEDVLASPLVADPVRVLDCASMADGAAAVVLSARRGETRVAGLGHATDDLSLAGRTDPDALVSFRATRAAAARCARSARKSVRDVDVVEMHDAFAVLEFQNLVDLGLVPRSRVRRAVLSGDTSLGGSLPVNPGGGIKARGHPVGATGVAQVVEIHRQLRGDAGRRQVDGARRGLVHNIGGYGNNVLVALLEAA